MHEKIETEINSAHAKSKTDSTTAKKIGYMINSHTMVPILDNIPLDQLVKNNDNGTNKCDHVKEVSTIAELEEFIAKAASIPAKK